MVQKAQHARRYRSIPGLLRQFREDAGMTQRALGEKLKEPQSWIHLCETGSRRVDMAEFCEWCKACGIDPLDGVSVFLKR